MPEFHLIVSLWSHVEWIHFNLFNLNFLRLFLLHKFCRTQRNKDLRKSGKKTNETSETAA